MKDQYPFPTYLCGNAFFSPQPWSCSFFLRARYSRTLASTSFTPRFNTHTHFFPHIFMSKDTRSVLIGFLSAVLLVVLVSFAGAAVHAKSGPSKDDYARLELIKKNQKILAK